MLVRNNNQELIIGLVALGMVGALAVVMVRQWQSEPEMTGAGSDAESLLQTLAALDDAHAAGQISESKYQQQREVLKQELIAIWPTGE